MRLLQWIASAWITVALTACAATQQKVLQPIPTAKAATTQAWITEKTADDGEGACYVRDYR